ncbi:MAG TPA: cobyrinate a,c-diamide synthase [Bryobacteraceae bacterium]|nr:cobyrinate a,c-diamide synthase [Bryobacteraceae bacterium]
MRAPPRLTIAGTHSGVGKTSIAIALMAALTRRGLRVQPFKIGPDFIDPGFHRLASGHASRNLDGWMLSREANLEIFAQASEDAGIAIIEGVMGLFDGSDAVSQTGSTAEIAKWLGSPVLLVIDASAMAGSAAALVHGFEDFDPDVRLAGVLCNRVGGSGHADILRQAMAARCRTKPLGFLPLNEKIALPERHLGLVMASESLSREHLSGMAKWIEAHVDIDGLLSVSREQSLPLENRRPSPAPRSLERRARIGLARDAAFCFYYEDNLDLLKKCGADLVEFSAISDGALPANLDALYLGGGYPELHAAELSENASMRDAIVQFAQTSRPIYAECGGFMYLCEAIVDTDGREYQMAGLFPTRVRMQKQLAAIAYVEAEVPEDALWLHAGQRLRGHEFHYSTIDEMPASVSRCFRLWAGDKTRADGFAIGSVLAGYSHLHFRSSPDFVSSFVDACLLHKEAKV